MTYRSPELVGLFALPQKQVGESNTLPREIPKSRTAKTPRTQRGRRKNGKLGFFAPSHSLRLRIPCAFAFLAPSHSLRLCILCTFAFLAPLHSLRLRIPCAFAARSVLSGTTNTQAEDYSIAGFIITRVIVESNAECVKRGVATVCLSGKAILASHSLPLPILQVRAKIECSLGKAVASVGSSYCLTLENGG
jgi:hypothetical protein